MADAAPNLSKVDGQQLCNTPRNEKYTGPSSSGNKADTFNNGYYVKPSDSHAAGRGDSASHFNRSNNYLPEPRGRNTFRPPPRAARGRYNSQNPRVNNDYDHEMDGAELGCSNQYSRRQGRGQQIRAAYQQHDSYGVLHGEASTYTSYQPAVNFGNNAESVSEFTRGGYAPSFQADARSSDDSSRRGWNNPAQRGPRGGRHRQNNTRPAYPQIDFARRSINNNGRKVNDAVNSFTFAETEAVSYSVAGNHIEHAHQDGEIVDGGVEEEEQEDLPISTDTQERRNDLTRALKNERYSCMICLDKVRRRHFVWSCAHCFHLYHLKCIQGWARAGRDVKGLKRQEIELLDRDQNFRCPACQHVNTGVPLEYFCFCGQEKVPEFSPFSTPHSCGKVCSRNVRNGIECSHRCTVICHPGACPPCTETITASCPCGKVTQQILCRNKETFICGNVCGKRLQCGRHSCQERCHTGECSPCTAMLTATCFCSKTSREIPCVTLQAAYYAADDVGGPDKFECDSVCDRLLTCGHHQCRRKCHAEACGDCSRLPAYVRTCACGKTSLNYAQLAARAKLDCRAPLITCQQTCGKTLLCGHKCALKCHDGECRTCDKSTAVTCQCKRSTRTIQCKNYSAESSWLCTKRCNKKLACDRHRCERSCCPIELVTNSNAAATPSGMHAVCDKVCNKKLSCGLHTCDRACGHRGPCPRCLETSYQALSCYCGTTVLDPPIACGTSPPECTHPCTRIHACGHAPTHSCHSAGNAEAACPPCVELVKRQCFGGHETRTVPCHVKSLSCGRICGRPLPVCGMHCCDRACHDGPCLIPEKGEVCRQPCVILRSFTCGHACGAPCHPKYRKCAQNGIIECKAVFTIRCACDRLEKRVACRNLSPCDSAEISFQPSLASLAAPSSSLGGGITAEKYEASFTLKCDAECEKQAINRRFAQALNINTMDVSSQLPDHPLSFQPSSAAAAITVGGKEISDFVKEFYRNNMAYCREAEQAVRTCVQKAAQLAAVGSMSSNAHWQRRVQDPVSKKFMPTPQLTPPSHTFKTAPKDFRHFLHELAEIYKCDSTSYTSDAGGIKKHIVIVARPGTCAMPTASLQDVMERVARATSSGIDADRFRLMSSEDQRRLLQAKLCQIVSQYYPATSIATKLTSMLMQTDHVLLLELMEGTDANRVAALRRRTDDCYKLLKNQERLNERHAAAGGGGGAVDEIVGITSDGAAVFEKKQPNSNSTSSDGPTGWVTVGGSKAGASKTAAGDQKAQKEKKIDWFDCDS